MTKASLTIETQDGRRHVVLGAYLDAAGEESAAAAAHAWIKDLRSAQVEDQPLRRRFTFREDSLWWFAELYLHKQQVVLGVFRTLAALEALVAAERPSALAVTTGDRVVRQVTRQFAARHRLRDGGRRALPGSAALRLAAMDARSTWLHVTALASRLRRGPAGAAGRAAAIVAFVHRAFWHDESSDEPAEQYIGSVLAELARRLPDGDLRYVSVGPPRNFRARRWWDGVVTTPRANRAAPVETFATLDRLRPSRRLWRGRHALRRALWQSPDLRAAARIRGCDCWPVMRHELAGIALLQWPWSARAMDEAGAALDALGPAAALTYAEAGGWGRAIVLECRRRGIRTAGLQHGFIYRHWLNYRHEPDEMAADPGHPADRGFPHPSVTLLFDGYARRHLLEAGHFPADALRVTGSPRLDELARISSGLAPHDLAQVRTAAGAAPDDSLVLVTTKFKEAQQALPGFLAAARQLPGVRVAIKTHPAETPEVYAAITRGLAHVTVLPAAAPLAPLIRASRVVVTVNSTVALDAAVLGVPTLVIGLPNNLSPFVEAGLMTGASEADAAEALRRILYDEAFRSGLAERRQDFLVRFDMAPGGRATERTADAVLALAGATAATAPSPARGVCD